VQGRHMATHVHSLSLTGGCTSAHFHSSRKCGCAPWAAAPQPQAAATVSGLGMSPMAAHLEQGSIGLSMPVTWKRLIMNTR
jgi:hypothetical protein